MTLLSDIPAERDPTHLLLIGQTKHGKSTYSANAVLAGWPMIYVDSDNGLSALRRALKGNEAAMSRVRYFGTERPCDFIEGMLNNNVFQWNMTRDKMYDRLQANPEDKVVEIRPLRIPHYMVLNVDSWSAVALNAMQIGATNKKTTLEEMAENNRMSQVYGDASIRLTLLLAILQKVKFHTIIQAHPTYYERLEKPAGSKPAEQIKQKDMIVKETTEIPLSSSRPHGFTMGKYFTDIGWIELNRMDERTVSFKAKNGRVSGGTVDMEGRVGEMGFAKVLQPTIPTEIDMDSWIRDTTHAELTEERARAQESKKAVAGSASPSIPAKPANPMLAAFKK